MGPLFDRYENTARRGEGLILPAGDPFPAGAVAAEWKKKDTVADEKLAADDKREIASKGYRYFMTSVELTVKEVGAIPNPQK